MRNATGSAATLAAMGIVGFASEANAALVTVTENISLATLRAQGSAGANIAVDSSTAQFNYVLDTRSKFLTTMDFDTLSGGEVGNANGSATIDTNPADYMAPKSLIIAQMTDPSGSGFIPPVSGFVNLEFTNGAGVTEFGYATFNTSNGTLESITYQPAAASVPESSTWAMLIAGAGMTGLVVRRRRRRSALLAAA